MTRKKFRALGVNEQRQWLTDEVHENSCMTELPTLEMKFVVAGMVVRYAALHGAKSTVLQSNDLLE